jgi:hypothetical protein
MSLPTVNDVGAIETVLTNMLVGYQQADSRFVASKVFPAIPVQFDSGTYYTFNKLYWFSDTMKVRAPGGMFAAGEFGISTGTFKTLQYALEYRIADEVRANSQVPMDLETAAVRWLAQKSLIRKERAFSTDFMVTSVWNGGTDGSVTYKWSDYDDSDPVGDVLTGLRTISNATGAKPNTAVMGAIVQQRLLNHPDLLDRIKYVTQASLANIDTALAAVFGVPNWYVSDASYNSADEPQTFTGTAIIDDDILLCYVSPNPGLFEASAGYTMAWAGGGGTGTIYNYRDDDLQADKIKIKEQWDQVAVASDLGYIIPDVTD